MSLTAPRVIGEPRPHVPDTHYVDNRIYTDPTIIAKLEKVGIFAVNSSTPAGLDLFIRDETRRWSRILKESGSAKLD